MYWNAGGYLKSVSEVGNSSKIDSSVPNILNMSLKTYGDKPISFQLEEGGEFYCIGSEVS